MTRGTGAVVPVFLRRSWGENRHVSYRPGSGGQMGRARGRVRVRRHVLLLVHVQVHARTRVRVRVCACVRA